MDITDNRNKPWLYGLALIGIFVFSLWGFIVEGEIVFGSIVSWQHFPVNMHYFQNIIHGKYPLFDFLFSVGFDAVGDSQQSLLHPLKIFLVLVGVELVQVSTFFLVAHIFMGAVGAGLYTFFMVKKSYAGFLLDSNIPFFSAAITLLSLAVYTNILHMVFLCVLAYFPYMLLLTEKIMLDPKRRYFFLLALVVTLMLLVGNYCIQWIALLSLVVYLAGLVFMNRCHASRAFIVLLAITFGFLIALVQLVPTYDLMGFSSRHDLGDWQMFLGSANPLSWLGYLSPGALFLQFKYANEAYWSYTGNNVIESAHYMGLVPLSLFFYSLWKRKNLPREIDLFHGVALVMVLRALGVFSIINIFLNTLPIFGQFRIPVRSFFILDFVLVMTSAYVLASNLDRAALKKVISALLVITFGFNLLSIVSIGFWGSIASQELPRISWFEYGFSFGGCFILLISLALVSGRISAFIDKKQLVLGLIVLSVVDLGFHRLGAPLHWESPTAQEIKKQNSRVDKVCDEIGASRIWMDFKWADFNAPRFPFAQSSEPDIKVPYVSMDAKNSVELQGVSCYFGESIVTSTLTPTSIKQTMKWAEEELTHKEFLSLMGILGYEHYAQLKVHGKKAVRINDIDIVRAPVSTGAMLNKFEGFLNAQPQAQKERFGKVFPRVYEELVELGVSDWLPRHRMKVTSLPQIGSVLALTQPMYYLVFDSNGKSLPYTIKGTFLIFPENVLGPVEVVSVPVGFILGFMGSMIALLLLIAVSVSPVLKSLFKFCGKDLVVNETSNNTGDFIIAKLTLAWSKFQKFLVSPWLKKYGGIFLAGSIIIMPMAALFFLRGEKAFPFIFLIFLLAVVYRFTFLFTGNKNIALGLTILLGSNFVIGKIFYLSQSILFSKKTQIMIMDKLPFIADTMSILN